MTRMTPKTLYSRSNSLLMCFGVPFHEPRFVPPTSAFEDSVHQLQASGIAVPSRQFVSLCRLETVSTNRPADCESRPFEFGPMRRVSFCGLSPKRNIVFISGLLWR